VMGDESFFQGVKDLFVRYQGKEAGFEDFQKVMEEHHGESLEWFFSQWYERTGYPHYKVGLSSEAKGDRYIATVEITQIQEEPFQMPADIAIEYEGGTKLFPKVMVDAKHQVLRFELPGKPLSVRLDEDEYLLKEVSYDGSEPAG